MQPSPPPRVRARRSARLALLALVLGALTPVAVAAPAGAALPAGFTDRVVLTGLSTPTVVKEAADGRIFVAEKRGVVKVFEGWDDTTATVFADLRTQVFNRGDRGLLGMTLDPDFPADPSVYVLYTHDGDANTVAPKYGTADTDTDPCSGDCIVTGRLSRLTADGDQVTGAEQVLVQDWCQQYSSHSIGALAFGADGALYASGGDGASFNGVDYGQSDNPCGDPPGLVGEDLTSPSAQGGALRSQSLRRTAAPTGTDAPVDLPGRVTLDGTVIRVDPATGQGLPDNPLAASEDANERRVVAYGLRNPFRMTPRPGTQEIWIGDTGWNSREEINRISDVDDAVVENFGWPCYEGTQRQSGYDNADLTSCETLYAETAAVTAPVLAKGHGGSGCAGANAMTGTAFHPVTGGSYPVEYAGAFFYADYTRNCIHVVRVVDGVPDPSTDAPFSTTAAQPISLETAENGDILYPSYDGSIHRITYDDGNQTPSAAFSATPDSGPAPLTVAFDATASSDPDGDALTYAWDLDGDGAFDDGTSVTAERTYETPGPVTVKLRVTDPGGDSDDAQTTITVDTTAPVPSITAPATAAVGDTVAFSGSASDPQDGDLPASALSWSAVLHHCSVADPQECHEHPPIHTAEGVASGSFTLPDHERVAYVELRLTATASDGEAVTTSTRIDYETAELTFTSDPAGIPLAVGSASQQTPFTTTERVNGTVSVSAPATATVDGTDYEFVSWSDGGAAVHDLTVPASATTYTAAYRVAEPEETVLFAEDFESGDDGWTRVAGTWALCEPSGAASAYCATTTRESSTRAGEASWTDYSVRAAVSRESMGSSGVVVIGRWQDARHYYQLELRPDLSTREPSWFIWKRDGDTWTRIAGGTYAYTAATPYHLRLTMVGSTLTAAVSTDGTAFTDLGSGSDTAYTSGRIGLRSWGTKATFDDVRVVDRRVGG